MSAPWYAPALERRDDAAWEIFHENSKRGPHDLSRPAGAPALHLDLAAFPVLAPDPAASPRAGGPRPVPHEPLLRLLAAGGQAAGVDDTTLFFVHLAAVDGLPTALAVHDPAAGCLRTVAADLPADRLAAAVAERDRVRAAAVIFLAADLAAATDAAGERGYRDALIAIGRHLAALEAAATPPLALRSVPFHDRAADDLLFLDGLSRSVLAVVAVTAAD